MRPLTISFSEPLTRWLGVTWFALAFAVAGLAWTGYLAWQVVVLRADVARDKSDLSRVLERPMRAAAVSDDSAIASRLAPAQIAAANRAIRQLNLPWRDVFDALEEAASKEVSVVAIEPEAQHRTVRVSAEVANADDMVAFIRRLKQQPQFETVSLRTHRVEERDPNHPLRFTVEAVWRAPEEGQP